MDLTSENPTARTASRNPGSRCENLPIVSESQSIRHAGFTLLEMLIVLIFIAALSCTMGVGISRTSWNRQAIQCQSNLGRLAVAWQMYARDNQDRIVPTGENTVGRVTPSGWVSGWLDWSTSTDNTNIALLLNARSALLGPYLYKSAELFRCPSDRYVSQVQASRGWTHRARSYSLTGVSSSVIGPPLDGVYKQVTKISQFQYPSPGETWIFLDEHPDSINDGQFLSPTSTWIDLPAVYHNGGSAFCFADGHAETHRWKGSLLTLPTSLFPLQPPPVVRPGDPDLHWVSYHTQRTSQKSY